MRPNNSPPTVKDLLELPSKHYQVRFACFCARQVLHFLLKKQQVDACKQAIEAAEAWLDGRATEEECALAAYAASTHAAYYAAAADAAYAADAAAADAADAAAHAASAAAYAAYAASAASASAASASAARAAYYADAAAASAAAAARAASADDQHQTITKQWEFYNDLLNIDKNLENAIGLVVE